MPDAPPPTDEPTPPGSSDRGNAGEGGVLKKVTPLQLLIGGIVLIVIATIVIAPIRSSEFLTPLRDRELARGVITFLVSIATISLGFILVVSSIFAPQDVVTEERFRRAREVFVAMMGVLGTIIGFYFGAADGSTPDLELSTIQVVSTEGGQRIAAHITGGNGPYTYSIAFDDQSISDVTDLPATDGWVMRDFESSKPVALTITVRDKNGRSASGRYEPPVDDSTES